MNFVDYSLFYEKVKNHKEENKRYHEFLKCNPHCPDCQKLGGCSGQA